MCGDWCGFWGDLWWLMGVWSRKENREGKRAKQKRKIVELKEEDKSRGPRSEVRVKKCRTPRTGLAEIELFPDWHVPATEPPGEEVALGSSDRPQCQRGRNPEDGREQAKSWRWVSRSAKIVEAGNSAELPSKSSRTLHPCGLVGINLSVTGKPLDWDTKKPLKIGYIIHKTDRADRGFSPPARWGLLDFMSTPAPSPPPPPRTSTTTIHAQCSLPDLNHDHPRPVFAAGPQPRPATPSVRCRTSTTTIHVQCSLPDLNHDHPRPVFAAGPQPRPSTPSVRCRTSTTTIHAQCSLPDLNRRRECQKICQIECQKIRQIECQKICQIKCQKIWQTECRKICQIECQKIRQIECQIECQKIWQIRMSEDMTDRMSEDMPDRMSEDTPDRMPDRMSEDMADRMSDRMPDRMSRRYAR